MDEERMGSDQVSSAGRCLLLISVETLAAPWTLLHSALCPQEPDLDGLHQQSSMPSGFCQKTKEEESGVRVFISPTPFFEKLLRLSKRLLLFPKQSTLKRLFLFLSMFW